MALDRIPDHEIGLIEGWGVCGEPLRSLRADLGRFRFLYLGEFRVVLTLTRFPFVVFSANISCVAVVLLCSQGRKLVRYIVLII